METTFKTRLRAREPLLGTFVKSPDPVAIEVLSTCELDCLCLDAEHAPFDRRDLSLALMAARAGGRPAIVRVQSGDPHHLLNALDLGATGVLVPHVRNGAEAQAVVRAAHYGPTGRGYAGGTRATGYLSPLMADRLAAAEANTTVIVQVEDAEALQHVEAIASTPGLDAVFVGRIDLTVSLGETDPKASRVTAAVSDVIARAARFAAVGLFTADPTETPEWRRQGASLFLLGSDHLFLRQGAARLRADAGL